MVKESRRLLLVLLRVVLVLRVLVLVLLAALVVAALWSAAIPAALVSSAAVVVASTSAWSAYAVAIHVRLEKKDRFFSSKKEDLPPSELRNHHCIQCSRSIARSRCRSRRWLVRCSRQERRTGIPQLRSSTMEGLESEAYLASFLVYQSQSLLKAELRRFLYITNSD